MHFARTLLHAPPLIGTHATAAPGRRRFKSQRHCLVQCTGEGAAEGHSPRRCVLLDRSSALVPYEEGWRLQKQCLQRAKQFAANGQPGHDHLILLQHHPVFTLGAGSSEKHVKFDLSAPPLPLHRVERGGEVTYHGPGQLVLYPIIDLQHHRKDLHWYMRSLEQVAIRALAAVSGLEGRRIEGLTGVWVDGAKVAAIGVRAQRWITYHGMALNIAMDLAPFDLIVPCGIPDRRVTSVTEREQAQHGAASPAAELTAEYIFAMQQAFVEVFDVELVPEVEGEFQLFEEPLGLAVPVL